MLLKKAQKDALGSSLSDQDVTQLKSAIEDQSVKGWAVFDTDGIELVNENISDTMTAVSSNILDLAGAIADELDEADRRPAVTMSKGGRELHTEPLTISNVLVFREKPSGFRKAG